MSGFIRKREVLANAALVIRLYGPRLFVAALFARKGTTFLALVVRYHNWGPPP